MHVNILTNQPSAPLISMIEICLIIDNYNVAISNHGMCTTNVALRCSLLALVLQLFMEMCDVTTKIGLISVRAIITVFSVECLLV
jgi:hypothetical protein